MALPTTLSLKESLLKPVGRYLAGHQLLNPWFGPVFNGLVTTQINMVLAASRLLPKPLHRDPLLAELTLVIKTFERRPRLLILLRSIRRPYPQIAIVAVDDSREPAPLDGVDYVTLPFDSGVSAGRNAGLARVRTRFVMILDDDFVFYRHTDLAASLRRLAAEPMIDLVGGVVITLPSLDWNDSSRMPIYKHTTPRPGGFVGGLERRRKVPNFFIARTERLASVGWDARLKRLDHIDFFTRADGLLCIVLDPTLRCLHAKSLFDRHYVRYRSDYQADLTLLRQRYPDVPVDS